MSPGGALRKVRRGQSEILPLRGKNLRLTPSRNAVLCTTLNRGTLFRRHYGVDADPNGTYKKKARRRKDNDNECYTNNEKVQQQAHERQKITTEVA